MQIKFSCFFKNHHLSNYYSIKIFKFELCFWWVIRHNILKLMNVDPTAQKMKFSIKDLFSKCDKIPSFLHFLYSTLQYSQAFLSLNPRISTTIITNS